MFESNGGRYLNVVFEAQWYRWRELAEEHRPARIPRATCVATRHVWIELLDPNPSTEEGEVSSMTATTEEPTVTLRLWADGTGEVIVEGVAAPIAAGALRAARVQGLAQVQQLAARSGEPVRFVSYDPEGRWHLVMSPDGEVTEDDGTLTAAKAAQPEKKPDPDPEPEPARSRPVALLRRVEPLEPRRRHRPGRRRRGSTTRST